MVGKETGRIVYQHLENAPIPILVCTGKELLIEFANRLAQPLLGISAPESQRPASLLFPDIFQKDLTIKFFENSLRNEPYKLNAKQVIYLTGEKLNVVWFDITINPLLDENGKCFGIIAYFIDVSPQVRSAQSIDQRDELSHVNELLQQRNQELHRAQSLLQQVIDSTVELIAVMDRDYKFLAVNKAFETFVHKSRSELVGKEIFVAYEGARGSRQVQLLEKVFAGETLHLKVNPSIARPDVWFDTHYVPLQINGATEGVIALSRDITDIIKSEQELAEANRQFKEAQRLAKLGSWEWDVMNGSVTWSDEMYHIYGYDEKFPVDFVKATERMSPEDADRSSKRTQEFIQRAFENYRNQGETVFEVPPSEIRITLPNEESKVLRNTGKIQLTPEGKLHRFLGVLQDVTQIRSVEDKLRHLIDELKVKNVELESFTSIASHDLKEPLRNIRTMIDLIRLKKDEDTSLFLGKIDKAAERMTKLIDSILKLSEVSNTDFESSRVNLNKVIDSCRADMESRIKDQNAQITIEELPTISANESQINQVFSNLLSNSLKFCTTTPRIEITCSKVSGENLVAMFPAAISTKWYWCISIIDNGIGFDLQFKERIFEPFHRLHGKSEYAGTGIGLSIVKKIIDKHNGFIDAYSQPGNGARFSVWLPV